MSDQFLAEIRIFGFNFAPTGWALCNGQIMPLSQNTALFSLLGTTYGGNGQSTFGLPNLQDRAPMQPGQGPGLSLHDLGEEAGEPSVTLLQSEMPAHSHFMRAHNGDQADAQNPSANTSLAQSANGFAYQSNANQNLTQLNPGLLSPTGGSQPHNNMMPFLAVNFCIALQGIFPPRS
jgi:microcystin-dependent protein